MRNARLTVAVLLTMGLGWLAALLVTDLISSQLVNVAPADPVIFGLAALFLTSAALLACYRPARRATRVDPLAAFRCQ